MPSQSAIQKMNKLLDNRKFRLKDSDKDGVPDMFDCRPHNPKKQGIIHDIKKKVGAKVESIKQRRKEEAVEREVREDMARRVAAEEREKQAVETARYKEKLRGERARAYAKSGGFLGSVGRFVDKASAPSRRVPSVKRRKIAPTITKRKRKKLKREVKRMTRRKKRARTQKASSYIFDTSSFKY